MAEALAMRDGLIVAVGDRRDVLAAAGTRSEEIDVGGRTVIPGLNDSHLHLTRGARYYGHELRWDGVRSLRRGLAMIEQQAQRTPSNQWVRVLGGWSPEQFDERRLPSPRELTQAAPDVPVLVLYLYSRAFLNAAGVNALGLTATAAEAAETETARYELTEDGGAIIHAEPDATLINAVIAKLPPPSEQEEAASAQHFYRELARFGITSAGDLAGGGHVWPGNYAATRALADTGLLPIRISNFLPPLEPGKELEYVRRYTEEETLNANLAERLRHGFLVEGVGEAVHFGPYDSENFLWEKPDLSKRGDWQSAMLPVVRHLLRARWPIRIHATYGETIAAILDVFEKADQHEREEGRAGFAGIRWSFEHAETVTPESLMRIARLGGGIAVQDRMAFAGEVFAERYGEEAASNAPPFADIVAAGIPLALGTDGTRAASYNPWVALDWAITGRTVGGAALMAPRHRRTKREALWLYAIGSAWFSGDEARKGRLAPGQYADLAVLSRPLLDIEDDAIAGTESLLTYCGGRPTWSAAPFAGIADDLTARLPEWSPINAFGGYQSQT